ncbi:MULTISPECIES: hypothetical protein [unclassified Xanthobacter]|uniref:hypothetical protein n=1 Tax=unclassified Xanthobacter TaxID=2623496 RepID=UPI001F1D929A|nr:MULTISPECIES: hypothetical protein [unclassified Xanthobacter]
MRTDMSSGGTSAGSGLMMLIILFIISVLVSLLLTHGTGLAVAAVLAAGGGDILTSPTLSWAGLLSCALAGFAVIASCGLVAVLWLQPPAEH